MSRPKPTILLEAVHKDTYKADQVLAAEAIFSVFYKGKPINLRTLNKLVSYLYNLQMYLLIVLLNLMNMCD